MLSRLAQAIADLAARVQELGTYSRLLIGTAIILALLAILLSTPVVPAHASGSPELSPLSSY